jgi:hypothetical protein
MLLMEKNTMLITTALLITLSLLFILGITSITGFTVQDRASSLLSAGSSAFAPILILSFVLAVGLFTLYEVRKK